MRDVRTVHKKLFVVNAVVVGVTINTNVASARGQRALGAATARLSATSERLSSGQRINRAADDAAGLAIADKLKTDTRLYSAAQKNLNDGISVLSIMNGALDQQSSILMRLAELAEQAANGAVSNRQRATLDSEYQALIKESGRIGDTTSFNGMSLLRQGRNGEIDQLLIQAGITGTTTAQLSIRGGDTGSLSGIFDSSKFATYEELLDINGDGNIDVADQDSLFGAGVAITTDRLNEIFGNNTMIMEATGANGQKVRVLVGLVTDTTYGNGSALVSFIETAAGSNKWYGTAETVLTYFSALSEGPPDSTQAITIGTDGYVTNRNSISIAAQFGVVSRFNIDISGIRFINSQTTGTESDLLEATRISSMTEARDTLDTIQRRLSNTSALRGKLGAFESRLGSALRLTAVLGTTTSAAEGRIRDADIASESAEYIRSSILQQVSASVLAQANLQPKIALQLLQ